MPEKVVSPASTVMFLLGSDEFRDTALNNSAFRHSHQAVKTYFTTVFGLGANNLLDLFRSPLKAEEQLEEIDRYLKQYKEDNPLEPATDLFVYYIGHGCYVNQEYRLMLRSSYEAAAELTALPISSFVNAVGRYTASMRCFYFLDACFSAAAAAALQGPVADVIEQRFKANLKAVPNRGTALLAASSKEEPAQSPTGHLRTMFTDSFLTVLKTGDEGYDSALTLSEVHALQIQRINDFYSNDIRTTPFLADPRQSQGLISQNVKVFPNLAFVESVSILKPETASTKSLDNTSLSDNLTKSEAGTAGASSETELLNHESESVTIIKSSQETSFAVNPIIESETPHETHGSEISTAKTLPGTMVLQKPAWQVLILSFMSLGIYQFYWYVKVWKDLKSAESLNTGKFSSCREFQFLNRLHPAVRVALFPLTIWIIVNIAARLNPNQKSFVYQHPVMATHLVTLIIALGIFLVCIGSGSHNPNQLLGALPAAIAFPIVQSWLNCFFASVEDAKVRPSSDFGAGEWRFLFFSVLMWWGIISHALMV